MAREVAIELARYRELKIYQPRVGDFVIKHGLLISTKWFGVVNYIDKEGFLHIVVRGHPKVLFLTAADEIPNNLIRISPSVIIGARSGNYTVMQQESVSNIPVWYV